MFSIYIILFWLVLVALRPTRKAALALLPWLVFACSYDAMRLYPNYEVNPIDVKGIYEAEKSLFGVTCGESVMIPGEYFNAHHCPAADFMAGVFYLCWVPVPLAFGLYLYLKGDKEMYLRFSMAFLLVNLLGFMGYYIHPAAPPWYAINYGFEPLLDTPGNLAGLERFDALTGLNVFHSIYSKNSNVFAAVPSLHAAYMLVATVYAAMSRQHTATTLAFAFICLGIWWTAVYSTHHYIIDVLLGILTTMLGIGLQEIALMRSQRLKTWLRRYVEAV